MSIELAPVASKEASPFEASKTTKSTEGDKANAANAANGSDTPPNEFLALLSQFAAPPAADAPVAAVPPDTSTLSAKTVVDPAATDAVSLDLSAVAQSPAAMDASSLIAQMQVGMMGQTPVSASIPPATGKALASTGESLARGQGADLLGKAQMTVATASATAAATPEANAEPAGFPKHKVPSLLAGGGDSSPSSLLGAVAASSTGDGSAEGGLHGRGGKSGAGTDKNTPSQQLQAALANQTALSRAEKAEQTLAQSSFSSPTVAIGETFRQLIEVAKSDKSTESGSSMGSFNASDRSPLSPSMAWDISANASKTIAGSADLSSATAGFGVDQPGGNPVAMWVSQNVKSAEITLDAQGNDPVQVSIQMSGNEAQVQIRSDVPETRELLSQAVSTLDSALQREGLSLSGVSVGTSLAGKDSSREPGQNGTQMGRLSGRLSRLSGVSMDAQASAQRVHVGASVQAALGRVDYFV